MKNKIWITIALLAAFAIPSFGQVVTGVDKDAIDLPYTKMQNLQLQGENAKKQMQDYLAGLSSQYDAQKKLYDAAVAKAKTDVKADPKSIFDPSKFTFSAPPTPPATSRTVTPPSTVPDIKPPVVQPNTVKPTNKPVVFEQITQPYMPRPEFKTDSYDIMPMLNKLLDDPKVGVGFQHCLTTRFRETRNPTCEGAAIGIMQVLSELVY